MIASWTRRSFIARSGALASASWLTGCGGGDAAMPACAAAPGTVSLDDAGLVVDSATGLLTKAPATTASPAMARFVARSRFGLFMHFGMNTFADTELGDGKAPVSLYAPPRIDADGWVGTAREAGIDHVLLVCKHHDGFCLWPTGNTDYTVANSGNATDVVGAVAEACRSRGVRLGIYYSLWDRHWDNLHRCGENTAWVYTPQQDADYLDYMSHHLRELLGNYGEVVQVWFDAAWAKPADQWPLSRVYDLVKRLQPACQMGVNSTMLDATQAQHFPSDFRLQDPYLPAYPDAKLATWKGRTYYLPWQTTLPINQHWFWHADDARLRSLDELETIYYRAVSQSNALVLNSPADTRGVMRADNAARLAELRQRLGLRPGGQPAHPQNLSLAASASSGSVRGDSAAFGAGQATSEDPDARWAADLATGGWWVRQDFGAPTRIDYVVLREYAEPGSPEKPFGIRAFTLEALVGSAWRTVTVGTGIGVSRLVAVETAQVSALQLRVTQADAPPSLSAFWAFAYPAATC